MEAFIFGAIVSLTYIVWKGFNDMAVNFDRLNASLQAQADAIEDVAEAIRDPQTDTASQAQADAIADQLDASVEALRGLAGEEREMDNPSPAEPESPVVEPGEPAPAVADENASDGS